jgi:tRNA uridine 5-carboxymethylaminomethyl modification enzyme
LNDKYEIIVIGGGHAGVEAAYAAVNLGKKTALITFDGNKIAAMSCNPAIGGLAKGHLVKEIDALGGIMAIAADKSGIQFRKLNTKKGVAVQGTRAQADRTVYTTAIREILQKQTNIEIVEDEVYEILCKEGKAVGVLTAEGEELFSEAVIVTTGTFLKGLMHVGFEKSEGGRYGDRTSIKLSDSLAKLGIELGRLKTGTPARLKRESIDFSKCAIQLGDDPPPFFRNDSKLNFPHQEPCYITYTNEKTHAVIRSGLDRSPLYTGVINGVGPRYCPSIEDKIVRFADKDRHQVFLEPEGYQSDIIYPNGISTSLPLDVQINFYRSIPGLEQVEFVVAAYAVEYDYAPPTQLKMSLETKKVENLFFAGQINGTSGYEEAAGQGLAAGINAVRKIEGKESIIFKRYESYIGVMIDDLVTKGTEEPYRMFTSRAEYRLNLREDNADLRMMEIAKESGMIDGEEYEKRVEKRERIARERKRIRKVFFTPDVKTLNIFEKQGIGPIKKKTSLEELLRRPGVDYDTIKNLDEGSNETKLIGDQVEIEVKYEGYLERERERIEKVRKQEELNIPDDMDYDKMHGLKNEVREKLKKSRPATLGQATRIPGMTPAAIGLLQVALHQMKKRSKNGR